MRPLRDAPARTPGMSSDDEELIARASARVGALLKGKYTLDRVLGIGGMATVYAATHRNGKEFAIKILHAELSMRSETRTRFLREGYLANRVNHPGAVAVLDDDVADDGGAFLVMELLHGQTMEAIWERARGRLPLQLVAGVALQLLEVLAAAHARGLVHRDIKPGNLMLTHDGHVKVLDFGIARLKDMANARTTQTGMVMGTPAFMAPEHALAKTEEIDAQTDLWAVGATMFTLSTGRLVHDAENTQQLLVKAATLPAQPFKKVMPAAPASFCDVLDRALAFRKADRWASATAMQAALGGSAREAFPKFPTPAVLSELLDELGEHERTNILGPTETPAPVDPRVSAPDPSELETGRGPAARPAGTGTAPSGPTAPTTEGSSERIAPPPIGLITAEAVATDSTLRRTTSRPRGAMVAGAGAAAVGIAAVLVFAMRAGSPSPASTAASATYAPATAASPAPSSVAVRTAATQAWTAVSVPAPAPSSSAMAVATSKGPPPSAPQAAPRPRPSPVTPSAAAAPPPPPVTAPAKPSCNPPYEFDEDGNKRWKRECL